MSFRKHDLIVILVTVVLVAGSYIGSPGLVKKTMATVFLEGYKAILRINNQNLKSPNMISNHFMYYTDLRYVMDSESCGPIEFSSYLMCKDLRNNEDVWELNVTPHQDIKIGDCQWKNPYVNDILETFVSSDKLYINIYNSDGNQEFVQCIDSLSGKKLWEKKDSWCLFVSNDTSLIHNLLTDQLEYSSTNKNIRWTFDLDKDTYLQSNQICDSTDYLYVRLVKVGGTNTKTIVLDKEDGNKLFEMEFEDSHLRRNNFLVNDKYYVVGKKIIAFDANNGRKLWEFEKIENSKLTLRIFNGFFTINNPNYGIDCYDINTREKIWSSMTVEELGKTNPFLPQLVDGDIWVFSPFHSNSLFILDTETGEKKTQYKLPNDCEPDLNRIYVPINNYIHGNKLYLNIKDKGFCEFSLPYQKLTYTVGSTKYNSDGNELIMDTSPQVISGRTYLPAKYVVEPLGGTVSWDAMERKVTCKLVREANSSSDISENNPSKDDTNAMVELWIGKPTAKVNGVETQIDPNNPDVVPTIIDGRTMVPMRFLAESLGCEVEWIADTKEIILTYLR